MVTEEEVKRWKWLRQKRLFEKGGFQRIYSAWVAKFILSQILLWFTVPYRSAKILSPDLRMLTRIPLGNDYAPAGNVAIPSVLTADEHGMSL